MTKIAVSRGIHLHYLAKSSHITHVMLLGVGQNGRNLRTISATVPDSVAVIEALPYHKIPVDQWTSLSVQAIEKIVTQVAHGNQVCLLAESQAAPIAIEVASAHPEHFSSVVLLAPLGFNKSYLGDSPAARYASLMARSKAFWRHPNQSLKIRANLDTLAEITRRSLPAFWRLRADYTNGAEQDAVDRAKKLAGLLPVYIYADRNDSLFPYEEISESIKNSDIILKETFLGSHINRATPKGLAQLQDIIASLPE